MHRREFLETVAAAIAIPALARQEAAGEWGTPVFDLHFHDGFPEAPPGQAAVRQRLQLPRRPWRGIQQPRGTRYGGQVRGTRDAGRVETIGSARGVSENRVEQRAPPAAHAGVKEKRSDRLRIRS